MKFKKPLIFVMILFFSKEDAMASSPRIENAINKGPYQKEDHKVFFEGGGRQSTFALGAGYGYSFTSVYSLELSYHRLFSEKNDDGNVDEYAGNLLILKNRFKTRSSFFFAIGLFYEHRKYDFDATVEPGDTFFESMFPQKERRVENFRSVGGLIGIGNQWDWNDFIIGCEWAGFSNIFNTSSRLGRQLNLSDQYSFNFLNFYVGTKF